MAFEILFVILATVCVGGAVMARAAAMWFVSLGALGVLGLLYLIPPADPHAGLRSLTERTAMTAKASPESVVRIQPPAPGCSVAFKGCTR
jgi:hypothetical protein